MPQEQNDAGNEVPVVSKSQEQTFQEGNKKFPWLAVLIAVVVTVLVVVAVGYFFFVHQSEQSQNELEKEVNKAENQLKSCANDLLECRDQLNVLESEVEQINKQAEQQTMLPYQGWSDYQEEKFGLQWKYPSNWQISEGEATVGEKKMYCVDFTSPEDAVLTICYRGQDEADFTTWPEIDLEQNYTAKTNVDIEMAGKKITEKTLAGVGGEENVIGIIYAQNVSDDETGYGARIAVGDYYLTAVAFNSSNNQYITTEEQNKMDLILGSLQLPQEQGNESQGSGEGEGE